MINTTLLVEAAGRLHNTREQNELRTKAALRLRMAAVVAERVGDLTYASHDQIAEWLSANPNGVLNGVAYLPNLITAAMITEAYAHGG